MNELPDELISLQLETIAIVNSVNNDYQKQFHADLSPPGWHLGHCVYTESYWIREVLLDKQIEDEGLRSLYVPELSAKQGRGSALPDKHKLVEWADKTQTENLALLMTSLNEKKSNLLVQEQFLLNFLIQHYSQHIETLYMILTERQLQNSEIGFDGLIPLTETRIEKEPLELESNLSDIGSDKHFPYDNEHPKKQVELDQFQISKTPVTNGEYLTFINAGGYTGKKYWSAAGWQWQQENRITAPHHWRLSDEAWFGIDHRGSYSLAPEQPVYGLSYFEAQACANYLGARLPHEYEWEYACKKNLLQKTHRVWEWCENIFHPYAAFRAYPYEGYSRPYFDGHHFVLRGGSQYTKKPVQRPTFRNYYKPDKRHIFAGLRLAYD